MVSWVPVQYIEGTWSDIRSSGTCTARPKLPGTRTCWWLSCPFLCLDTQVSPMDKVEHMPPESLSRRSTCCLTRDSGMTRSTFPSDPSYMPLDGVAMRIAYIPGPHHRRQPPEEPPDLDWPMTRSGNFYPQTLAMGASHVMVKSGYSRLHLGNLIDAKVPPYSDSRTE